MPYCANIVAESSHVSGVLAVVAAGLVRGRYSPEIVSAEMRITKGLEHNAHDVFALQLQRVAIRATRAELIRLWRENAISDELMRH